MTDSKLQLSELCILQWRQSCDRLKSVEYDGQTLTIVSERRSFETERIQEKNGNHQRVPVLGLTGYDAWSILLEQKNVTHNYERVFPHNEKSTGIEELHFHDLRHEATSRLFEAGLSVERVALVTGHKD